MKFSTGAKEEKKKKKEMKKWSSKNAEKWGLGRVDTAEHEPRKGSEILKKTNIVDLFTVNLTIASQSNHTISCSRKPYWLALRGGDAVKSDLLKRIAEYDHEYPVGVPERLRPIYGALACHEG